MKSVLSQTSKDFEYVVVDGGSTDGSVEVIRRFASAFGDRIRWISEPDKGIYNAMNKGIEMASGQYVQFLNSGDCLVNDTVLERMTSALVQNDYPTIIYGNMLKCMPDGIILKDKCFAGQEITFLGFYVGTLNHSPAYIRRSLFEKYGLYDESLRIVSDWKWYLQAIVLGEEKPVYADINMTYFDMNGISETNLELRKQERESVLRESVNPRILSDYKQWSFAIEQMKRLRRHPIVYKLVWFMERLLFKMEKWSNRKNRIQIWH